MVIYKIPMYRKDTLKNQNNNKHYDPKVTSSKKKIKNNKYS